MNEKSELTREQQEAIGSAGVLIQDAIEVLEQAGVMTREFALVRTKLEEADMWYDRALDAIGYHYAGEDEDEDEDEDDDKNASKSKGSEEE